jgi:hypothetical protein
LKQQKNICLLNLFLFLGSFILFSTNSFSSTTNDISTDYLHSQFTSKQTGLVDASLQQLLEERESETESDFELLALSIPFYFSYFEIKITHYEICATQSPLSKIINPIYLAVCNFRV